MATKTGRPEGRPERRTSLSHTSGGPGIRTPMGLRPAVFKFDRLLSAGVRVCPFLALYQAILVSAVRRAKGVCPFFRGNPVTKW
jgi:hypothetical protein